MASIKQVWTLQPKNWEKGQLIVPCVQSAHESRHWKWKKGSDSSKRKRKAERNLNKAWYHSCEQIRGLLNMSISCIYFCSFFLATNNDLVLFRRQQMLEVINIFIIAIFLICHGPLVVLISIACVFSFTLIKFLSKEVDNHNGKPKLWG